MNKEYFYIIKGNNDRNYEIKLCDDVKTFKKQYGNLPTHKLYYIILENKSLLHIFQTFIIENCKNFRSYRKTMLYIKSFKNIYESERKEKFNILNLINNFNGYFFYLL